MVFDVFLSETYKIKVNEIQVNFNIDKNGSNGNSINSSILKSSIIIQISINYFKKKRFNLGKH